MARYDIPRITWGASFANQLDIGYALDNSVSWSEPREGSEYTIASSGEEDAWITGEEYYLAGDVRWIPINDATNPVASGWDVADGWRAFLEWARDKQQFRFIPDKDTPGTFILSYLVEPMDGPPGLEQADMTRRLRLVIRNASNAYTGY